MEEKRVILIVGTDCPNPDKEREFNEWYDGHVREVLKERPGVKRVTRYCATNYRVDGPEKATYPKYLAFYEFDSEESLRQYDAHRTQLKQNGQYQQRTWKYEEQKTNQSPAPKLLKEKWRTSYTMITREGA